MLGSLFKKINRENKLFGKKTFTYFIAAPPHRKTGYQEKEFDHIISYLTEQGFEILDIKLQTLNTEKSSGLWVICLLGAKTREVLDMDLDLDYSLVASKRKQSIKISNCIEHEC